MTPDEIKNILNEKGAISDYYEICYFPIQEINNITFNSGDISMYIDDFIKKFINNPNVEHIIYIYDIDESIFRIHKDIKIKDIRWFESNIICKTKLRSKKLNKINNNINNG